MFRHFLAMLLLTFAAQSVSGDDTESFAVRVIDEATLGLVRGGSSNSFAAYSKIRERWSTHTFADHLTIKPWTLGEFTEDQRNDLVVAFEYSGGPVTELVAVDCKGRFRTHELPSALNSHLRPVLNGDGVIYYIANEIVYAFSGKTGTWDAYAVPGLPDVQWAAGTGRVPSIRDHGFDTESKPGIVITRDNGTAAFLADKGLWQFIPSNTNTGG